MLDPAAPVTVPPRGVRDAAVESLFEAGIRCIVSQLDLSSSPQPAQQLQKEDALQLHHVVSTLFQQAAVIPFRFPTLLPESELREFVKQNSAVYREALSRLREMVQMELRITSKQGPPVAPASGTEYLQALQASTRAADNAADAARNLSRSLAQDWRERPLGQGLRCYALVRRQDVEAFREKMRSLPIGDMVTATINGPWPATEFLEQSGAEKA
jgi:hypothetical protein